MRVHVTGADGMLGTAFTKAVERLRPDWRVHGVSRKDFDIADAAALNRSVGSFRPDVIVHTAAHAIVDECESDPKHALRVNTAGVRNVAEACRRHGSRLVYISSDYVFDGADAPEGGYREHDVPNPLSVYGLTKLAGERIASMVGDHLNIRTSWLFGGADERVDNVLAMVRLARRGESVRLIADQVSLPTYTVDLAEAVVVLLARNTPITGTIHIANAETASWYDVGRHVFSLLGIEEDDRLIPISMEECGFLGGRPRDSTLHTGRLAGLGHTMPDWRDAVRRFCAELDAGELRLPKAVVR